MIVLLYIHLFSLLWMRTTAANQNDIRRLKDSARLSEETGARRLFQRTYEERCGTRRNAFELTGDHGTVATPGYWAGAYQDLLTCTYLIRVPEGKHVRITFTDFQVDSSMSCGLDHVSIYDGDSTFAHRLDLICGHYPDSLPYYSSGQSMYLVFHTSVGRENRGRGFLLEYTALSPAEMIVQVDGSGSTNQEQNACQSGRPAILTGSSGMISSEGSIATYSNQILCEWRITVSTGQKIRLNIRGMNMEGSTDCGQDGMWIYDGIDANHPLSGYFCGSCFPEGIISTQNSIFIHFTARPQMHRHLQVEYSTVADTSIESGIITQPACGYRARSLLLHPENTFSSPCGDNGNYLQNTECQWELAVPDGQLVELTFSKFNLERPVSQTCVFDKVQVYDGSTTSSELLGEYCGSWTPAQLLASSNRMLVVFTSDHQGTQEGFKGLFIGIVPPDPYVSEYACGVNQPTRIQSMQGVVASYGYPSRYLENQQCTWLIEGNPYQNVELYFEHMDIEHHKNCSWDSLSIYDGDHNRAPLLYKLCGHTDVPIIYSSSGSLLLEFLSDNTVNLRGFLARFAITDKATEACSSSPLALRQADGVIASPLNHVTNHYPPNSDCQWQILLPDVTKIVHLQFQSFDIYYEASCSMDYLEMIDGPNIMSPPLTKLCGQTPPTDLYSTSNSMFIHFVSNSNIGRPGFVAVFHSIEPRNNPQGSTDNITPQVSSQNTPELPTACTSSRPESLGNLLGSFSSPRMPSLGGMYPFESLCEWLIEGVPDKVIHVNFTSLKMEYHRTCEWDKIQLFDGPNDQAPLLATFCGRWDYPPEVTSSQQSMFIKFVTDSSIAGEGFSAQYHCIDQSRDIVETNRVDSGIEKTSSNDENSPTNSEPNQKSSPK